MRTKSLIAVVIFLVIVTLPFLVSAGSGNLGKGDPRPLASQTQYVQGFEIERMRNHMEWLKPEEAKATCLGCHSNKEQFCNVCHDYAGVKPGI